MRYGLRFTALVKAHIEKQDACYDFYLHKRLLNGREENAMPIENARTVWGEEDSRPVRVAQLRIPRQRMDDDSKRELCERAEFSPWQTTKDLRPLGNLNRVRRAVYESSARARHEINRTEPPFR